MIKKGLIAAGWVAVVGAGMSVLLRYENSPGAAGDPSARWPAGSGIRRADNRATLVMLAHPHCPCTRASIGELDTIMARAQGRVAAQVLFYRPADAPRDWEKSDLWDKAAAIPDVSVAWDNQGLEARRFHAATSGQVVLYDARGRLLFSGGITEARGHSGDNIGRDAIIAALTMGAAGGAKTFVFGCSLLDARPEPPQ